MSLFSFRITRTARPPDRATSERADQQSKMLADIRKMIMTVSAQVQHALEGIRQTQSLLQSYQAATQLVAHQNAELQAKVTELQNKLDAGQPINADDLAALAEISSDIDQVNSQLSQAVPANTGNNDTPPASAPPKGRLAEQVQAPQQTPPTDDQHTADNEAASQAKPLPGTGG